MRERVLHQAESCAETYAKDFITTDGSKVDGQYQRKIEESCQRKLDGKGNLEQEA